MLKPLLEFEVKRGICKVCRSEQKKSNYLSNKSKILDNKKQYRAKNKKQIQESNAAYYLANRDRLLLNKVSYYIETKEQKRQYYLNNATHIAAIKSKYSKERASYFAAVTAKRRALKLQATPLWLNKTQKLQIQSVYSLTRLLTNLFNIKFEVDHIVPLKGVNCRGLHVPWNLQILTKSDNCSKGNKYD